MSVSSIQPYATPRLSRSQGAELLGRIIEASRKSGLLRPAVGQSVIRLCFFTLCFGVSLYLAWFSTSVLVVGCAFLGLSCFVSQLAFLAHSALHGAISTDRATNQIFGQISMTVFAGLGYDEWKKRHREHHIFCQVDGRDPDIAVSLVASLTRESALQKGQLARALGRFQGIYLWGLTLLFGHSQRMLSQMGVFAEPDKYRWDLAMLAMHYALWIALPLFMLDVPLGRVVVTYLVPATILGVHLAAVFWVNHVGMPLIRDPKSFSIVERQVVTTRNVRVPGIVDPLFGGLNYQIEHHLVPSCPPFRLRKLRSVVRPILMESGLPYNEMSWWTALRDVGAHFRFIGTLMDKPESRETIEPADPA